MGTTKGARLGGDKVGGNNGQGNGSQAASAATIVFLTGRSSLCPRDRNSRSATGGLRCASALGVLRCRTTVKGPQCGGEAIERCGRDADRVGLDLRPGAVVRPRAPGPQAH